MSESLQSEIMTRRKSEENRRVVIIKSFLSDEMAMGCEVLCCFFTSCPYTSYL